jgi:hypothetical protein
MGPRTRILLLAATVLLGAPESARAGMPVVTLTDVARMRVQTISFFLAGLLLSALAVRFLWNALAKDFSWLPRLTYGKAVGVVVLWGLLFVLVLTMISGARELMTPGAWEKQGLTYRLATHPAENEHDRDRRRHLERLRAALWKYAEDHGGQFPATESSAGLPPELWVVPGVSRLHYRYAGGQAADRGAAPLVYEPGVFGDRRLVLLTNGAVRLMGLDEILTALPPEDR